MLAKNSGKFRSFLCFPVLFCHINTKMMYFTFTLSRNAFSITFIVYFVLVGFPGVQFPKNS